jgi:putative hemolysin
MKNKLVDTDDILKAARLGKIGGKSAARVLMLALGLNKINRIYAETAHYKGLDFVESILSKLDIKFEVTEEDVNRIPKSGPFITISNHPFGGIEGLLLFSIIHSKRPDYKFLGNFLLQRIEPMSEYILPVNPFETHKDVMSSVAGLKAAYKHIEDGNSLALFPAGEVSSLNPHMEGITDRQWQNPALKFIKNAKVPVVPIYFQGSNSWLFHLLGLIHPLLRTARIPYELMNKKNKLIRIRIGNPISVKDQAEFHDIARFGRFLRAKTYALGSSIEVKKFFSSSSAQLKKEEPVIDPTPPDLIEQEIQEMKDDHLLFTSKNYSVYCAPTQKIPNILNELGRLREITFREIGEGTNKKIDVDEFDLYYNHLFVWDDDAHRIVGAYRVGKGADIIREYGPGGFYVQTLFRINKGFTHILRESLELGRSFIVKDYQRKPMPLFLLWKGILYFLIKNPEYRYLIGPVSVSNRFSSFSKNVIIEFIKQHYFHEAYARFIKPRNKFTIPPITSVDMEILYEITNNISKLDEMIEDIETNFRMPVLLKKYLQVNGKIIGFNIDPKFNECLDGLLILDLFDVPMDTIASLSKEFNDETLLDRFYANDAIRKSSPVPGNMPADKFI